ncbi:MAG: PAS domain S-box protein [Desulfobacteraceae bacterium]|nr:PAS domain S-box protein [Desulfobacteraceae bacterium]
MAKRKGSEAKESSANVAKVSQQINNILIDTYAPPGVLVDSNMQIRQFVGHIFSYIGPVSGEASLKLSKMVGEGLMPDLYVAIEEVKKKKEKVRKKNISFKQNNKVITTDISVIPVSDPETSETNFLILFEGPETLQASEIISPEQEGNADGELLHLKQELQLTKEHLQSIIEELQEKNIELTVTKEFAENLLETANMIVLTLDSSATIRTFNKYAEELSGYKKDDAIGKNWFDLFIPPQDKESIPKVFEKALRNMPEISQYENHIVLKSGMERLISWSNNILRDISGKIEGVLSIGVDITERKMAEDALRESESKLHRAQYIAKMGDFTWNIQTGKVLWSDGMHHLLKYDKYEIIDYEKVTKDIHHPEDAERVTKWLTDSIASGQEELALSEYRLICKDGEVVYVQTNGRIEYKEGEAVKLFGTCLNITERMQAEKEKIEAQQYAAEQEKHALVGQIAGKMAHDFNNILGVIMGNTELTLMECKDLETKKTLELIFEQTVRGKNLTKNLVAFAKSQELKQEFFRINERIDLVINLLKKDLKGIALVKEDKPGVPELLADSGMIEHALVNLIQNSIHALSKVEHPIIIFRTYFFNDNICFEIEDNGCGIPREHLENIYMPSFTLKGSKDTAGVYGEGIRGTGYGMSNVKKYIEQHKGNISVESEPGSGTKFTISIPVIKKELTNKEKVEISKSESHFEKYILLVEDEPAISDVQYRILTQEPCNHKVGTANNGKVAIDLFERNEYDLISLDYVLPGTISGMDVYNHIRKTNKTIPILFISGNIEFLESIKELKQRDANIDHLSKPCRNKEYLGSINKLLERAGAVAK